MTERFVIVGNTIVDTVNASSYTYSRDGLSLKHLVENLNRIDSRSRIVRKRIGRKNPEESCYSKYRFPSQNMAYNGSGI